VCYVRSDEIYEDYEKKMTKLAKDIVEGMNCIIGDNEME